MFLNTTVEIFISSLFSLFFTSTFSDVCKGKLTPKVVNNPRFITMIIISVIINLFLNKSLFLSSSKEIFNGNQSDAKNINSADFNLSRPHILSILSVNATEREKIRPRRAHCVE